MLSATGADSGGVKQVKLIKGNQPWGLRFGGPSSRKEGETDGFGECSLQPYRAIPSSACCPTNPYPYPYPFSGGQLRFARSGTDEPIKGAMWLICRSVQSSG